MMILTYTSHRCVVRCHTTQVFSDDEKRIQTGTFIIGRIRRFHVRKDILTDSGAIDTSKLLPVSRLGGISYGRVTEAFGKLALSTNALSTNKTNGVRMVVRNTETYLEGLCCEAS